MHFINQQNKRHFALFHYDTFMESREEKVNWIGSFLNIHSSRFNKTVSKISPRRGASKFLNQKDNDALNKLIASFDLKDYK